MIYVDLPMMIGGKFNGYCHMWTDGTEEELHEFAESIGLKRKWHQNRPGFSHYDISEKKRAKAIAKGAQVKMLGAWMRDRKNASSN